MLFLFYVNVSGMRPLSHLPPPPAFEDTGSLGFPPRRVVYPPGSTLGEFPRFLAGNREAELIPTTFSLLLRFRVFLSFLFS